jgi:hypothetical protein
MNTSNFVFCANSFLIGIVVSNIVYPMAVNFVNNFYDAYYYPNKKDEDAFFWHNLD